MMTYLKTTDNLTECRGYPVSIRMRYEHKNKKHTKLNTTDFIHIAIGLIGLLLIILCSVLIDIYILLIIIPSVPFFIIWITKNLTIERKITSSKELSKSGNFVVSY